MDTATEMKAAAERTQENVEGLADEAKSGFVDAKEHVEEDLNQAVDGTKKALGEGIDQAQEKINTAIKDSKEAVSNSKEAVTAVIDNPETIIDSDVKAEAAEVKGSIETSASQAKSQVETSLEQAQKAPSETIRGVTRQMADAGETRQASAEALKRRLDWGEPALTIIDVRHRESFNQERIRGAISMPEADLVEHASDAMEYSRELFIYGETATQAEQSMTSLKQAGFTQVATINGGMSAWKTIGGSTEGSAA